MIDYNKLVEYGFIKKENTYLFKTKICDGQFEVIVSLSDNEKKSKVIDLATEDEYVLVDIEEAAGEFVGKVRNEYENLLQDIIEKCTSHDIFKRDQSKKVIKYIKEKYGDELEFLWQKFDNNAIWRNKANQKWYGLILTVSEDKIGGSSKNEIEIIDLRYQKDKIQEIIDNKTIYPGYHMNKSSWITIKLDNSVETENI